MRNNEKGAGNKEKNKGLAVRTAAADKALPGNGSKAVSANPPRPAPQQPEARKKNTAASPTEAANIQNTSPDTTMEVHHHPQLSHTHKPWKEYLLEGFMIFIAVMMGFIAENIREGITNKEHARQLTVQLVHDLKSDTAALNSVYKGETRIIRSNDSLFSLLQQPLAQADLQKVQKFLGLSHSLWPYHPAMGAITAIKTELHLKQFSESGIISYIFRYEAHIELLHTVQNITLEYQRNYLDPFMVTHFSAANLQAAFDHVPVPQTGMRNLTQDDFTQLAAQMVIVRINTGELLDVNRQLMKDAADILAFVKKQYGLDDER